jgi:amino acid permease
MLAHARRECPEIMCWGLRHVAGRYSAYWIVARVAIVAVVATAAAALPNMEQMVSLTGAVAFASVGFILPGSFFLKLRPSNPTAYEVGLCYFIVLLGVFGGVWGVYSTFQAGVQSS